MSGPVQSAEETFESCCEKYKQIFVLRNRTDDGAVPALMDLFHSTGSVLLRHEIAYALGQMQVLSAVEFLTGLLEDGAEDPITRHEAAEALGAIQSPESLAVLERHAADGATEVAETCALALAQLQFLIQKGACGCERRPQEVLRLEAELEAEVGAQRTGADAPPGDDGLACERPAGEVPASSYTYVSPAPAARAAPVAALRAQLLDGTLPLFERCAHTYNIYVCVCNVRLHGARAGYGGPALIPRFRPDPSRSPAPPARKVPSTRSLYPNRYRALFALRDAVPREGEPAVHALCAAFDDGNPLLKHEIAFVLGQLEHPAAVEALCAAVRCEEEHGMVRHEAAEALGAIGSPDAISVLREFSEHPEPILRESCWVALHMYDREAFLASGVCV